MFDQKSVQFDMDQLEEDFGCLLEDFAHASTFPEQEKWFKELNDLRFLFETKQNEARLKHYKDMKDVHAQKEFAEINRYDSRYMKLVGDYYEALLTATFRNELEDHWGQQLFRLAALKQNTYAPVIDDDLRKENELVMEYHAIFGNASIEFQNEELSLSALTPHLTSPDRNIRKMAHQAKYQFFADHEDQFDRILDELVHTRHAMAIKLGYSSFTELGYRRMNRTSHTPEDLKIYRDQVKTLGVPFVCDLRKSQQRRIGVESLKHYDENYLFGDDAPSLKGPSGEILQHMQKLFAELSPETKSFFEEMTANDQLDFTPRPHKVGGNFATYLGPEKSPYIFVNLYGIPDDIRVFTHEMGHAFQFHMSRHWNIPEYIIPYDSAEVFSFGMERLAWPWLEYFFGAETDRYKYIHLISAFLYMPVASAVDEFEHYLYEKPTAAINERKSKWRELEQAYLPFRDYDDNVFLEAGTSFYEIGHLFTTPFYFMDYDLAHFCSVQLWRKQLNFHEEAWKSYLEMCLNGGKLPFNELIRGADIQSPFEENSLEPLLEDVKEWIIDAEKQLK
ncbi:M3 family oligoendopeptidase [Pseudalkalibacillus sp. SCS-8]|uniref:M3 family oligoendopeptidase n=1 Tax=Pseudalkalibacillus nanhaiensis TaxID=3115291 RepID=UPI0032DB0F98